MTAHLDPDQLADLSAGLLDGATAAAAQSHLARCAHCRADADLLGRIPEILQVAADVGPMPDDVGDRLDAALAAEQPSSQRPDNVRPLPVAATRRWWADHRILQTAAAAVLVFAGGAIAVPLFQASIGSHDAATSSSGAKKVGPPEAGAAADSGTDHSASVGVLESGTHYTEQTVAEDVSRLLAAPERTAGTTEQTDAPAEPKTAERVSATSRLADPEALAQCVRELAPGGKARPLLVDLARFNGREAAVIVLPRPGEEDRLEIWVVGPGCTRGNAHTLHYQNVPRT